MRCPHCNEESFAKKKNLTDGWKISGQIQVCALCGKEWPADEKQTAAGNSSKKAAATDQLAALLGGDLREKVELAGEDDRKFCRNCRWFIVHPFKTLCSLTDKEADPMGECSRFQAK